MKSLSLYIDKWFITVAVNIDGNVLPLFLPNNEDRIWLFFHEDVANSRIEYGKDFEIDYRDRLPHYIGDVFNLIEEGDYHFTRYDKRPEEIKEIFKVSGIFNHLHQAVEEEGLVDTYISFSADISDLARFRFIEELREANFNVVESVARISHLALEECKKRNVFTERGNYLVLVATNDNFHYSLYENKGNIFLRKNEGELKGLGLDVRRRALVESVVENINRSEGWLKTREEIDQECVRQDRFAPEWLAKIAKGRPGMPVAFDNITFAIAPNNPRAVTVFPKELDERTTGIVDDIVRRIADFVKENHLQSHEVNGIVFIGNTFTNQTFTRAINNRFIVDDEKIVTYREEELPKVVSVYSQIDCAQFKGATDAFVMGAETQAILNRQAKEEAEKRRKAEEDARRQQEIIDSQKKAERDYANAIENIERYESDHNYEEMIEWCEIALKNRSDDEYAKEKAALARQLLADQRATNKQFNVLLQRAKTAFSEERWNDAVSQSDMALELRPDSDEASRLKKEARRRMEIKDMVRKFLDRSDVFFAQGLYEKALEEIEKVKNLEPNNPEAAEIKRKIDDVSAKHQESIAQLTDALQKSEQNEDFDEALRICDQLIEEDVCNLTKWTGKKERIRAQKRDLVAKRQKLNEARTEINKALFDEDWPKLIILCENYLTLDSDEEVAQFLAKGRKKIEDKRVKDAKEKALGLINSLIIEHKLNEASKEVNRFELNYPSEHAVVKDLRRKIFDLESKFSQQETEVSEPSSRKRTRIGFNPTSGSDGSREDDDDFFGAPVKPTKRKPSPKATPKPQTAKKDDFFDSTSDNNIGDRGEKKITNNDFNF